MKRVFVAGMGAVSPAGWGVKALTEALAKGEPLPQQTLVGPQNSRPVFVREVPRPCARPASLAHPRLRRSTAVAQYTACAAVEAMGEVSRRATRPMRIGLIACFHSGAVIYSCRFFAEVLDNPSTASPMLFPETVFSACASHIAVVMGGIERSTTLMGDTAVFLQGMQLACDWLEGGGLDAVLVVSGDETNWVHAHAASLLDRGTILALGGGALVLTRNEGLSSGVAIESLVGPVPVTSRTTRSSAARTIRERLPPGGNAELFVGGLGAGGPWDEAEAKVWRDWPGKRDHPKRILGEGLSAGAAWQVIAACEEVRSGRHDAACVSAVGINQQAMGARFARHVIP